MDEPNPILPPARASRRRRIVAVVLSIVVAGAGQVMLGHVRRGYLWLGSDLLVVLAFVGSVVVGPLRLLLPLLAIAALIRLASIADTLRLPLHDTLRSWKRIIALIVLMIGIGEAAGEIAPRWFSASRIPTPSMYPALYLGDRFMSALTVGKVERGDIVQFSWPSDEHIRYVKRVVAVGGDTIEMRDGKVVLNGTPVDLVRTDEPCKASSSPCTIWRESIGARRYRVVTMASVDSSPDNPAHTFGPIVVPAEHVFVLGDNRDNSQDSRYQGVVPIENVVGRPRVIYWASDESGIHWNRINQVIE